MRRWTWPRWLAGAAALAGALAPLAGSPYRRAVPDAVPSTVPDAVPREMTAMHGSINVAELARVVADQDDHVTAVQLATWIRERQPRLRVIDVRSAPEFRAYHIPGAEHIPLENLATAGLSTDETIVLYSEAGAHGAQAWVFLRALGLRQVFFLRAGLHEWLDDVMSPTLAAGAPADAQAAFDRIAELSRWFGGTPRRLTGSAADAPNTPTASEARAIASRRRGC